jgi:hypothetical protein
MSTCTKARTAAMMIVIPPMTAIRLTFVWPILKPSKNTG